MSEIKGINPSDSAKSWLEAKMKGIIPSVGAADD